MFCLMFDAQIIANLIIRFVLVNFRVNLSIKTKKYLIIYVKMQTYCMFMGRLYTVMGGGAVGH